MCFIWAVHVYLKRMWQVYQGSLWGCTSLVAVLIVIVVVTIIIAIVIVIPVARWHRVLRRTRLGLCRRLSSRRSAVGISRSAHPSRISSLGGSVARRDSRVVQSRRVPGRLARAGGCGCGMVMVVGVRGRPARRVRRLRCLDGILRLEGGVASGADDRAWSRGRILGRVDHWAGGWSVLGRAEHRRLVDGDGGLAMGCHSGCGERGGRPGAA